MIYNSHREGYDDEYYQYARYNYEEPEPPKPSWWPVVTASIIFVTILLL